MLLWLFKIKKTKKRLYEAFFTFFAYLLFERI
jgi:hypothetical protein